MSDVATRSDNVTPASALPFWLSLSFVPLFVLAMNYGGWFILAIPLYGWWAMTFLDVIFGNEVRNRAINTPDSELFWFRLITLIWLPVQLVLVFGGIWYVTNTTHLTGWEKVGMMFAIGVTSGTIGIVYAHELFHKVTSAERHLGDALLAMVLYSHFRTEHMLVHHPWVGTSRDTVTARYNEGFHRYFPRVLRQGINSAWRAERALLARGGCRCGPFAILSGNTVLCSLCFYWWLMQ